MEEKTDEANAPTVYVVAGPNGAGKTTFATQFLPHFAHCQEFLNADLIAAGLSPFAPETQSIRAGRLLLTRIRELTAIRQNFGFETTLAGRTYARYFREIKDQGYRIVLFFLWLPTADLAVSRVAARVRQGGHDVPEEDIRRRFKAGLQNLFGIYRPLLDRWRLFDASQLPPRLLAIEDDHQLQTLNAEAFEHVLQSMKEEDNDPLT